MDTMCFFQLLSNLASEFQSAAGLARATGNIDPLNNRGSLFYKCNIPIHLTRKTPIGSATTVMRVIGKYVERPKQLCVNKVHRK